MNLHHTTIPLHRLKTHPAPFQLTWDHVKRFELCRDDRRFEVGHFEIGHMLELVEWDPATQRATGREILARIVSIVRAEDWPELLQPGACVLGIETVFRQWPKGGMP